MTQDVAPVSPLDRARHKAYRRLIPLVFLSYVIAYIDRTNVSIAKLTMVKDLPGFDNAVFGAGAGIFFIGYFLLEIPGSLLVERWSARKWISRIMISWGIIAALTAAVKTPGHFYVVRFFLGLAEAGFFPGVIVYLTHWFPVRDRARALAMFFIAGPIAGLLSPKISNLMMKIGTTEVVNGVTVHHPQVWGMNGWQWVYIAWGIPAVILGVLVFFLMTDRPAQARWLTDEERRALEDELERERRIHGAGIKHMGVLAALKNPKVLLLALAYFFAVTGNYGVEFFLPTILQKWHGLSLDQVTTIILIPYAALLLGQVLVGWSSDRTRERWLHASLPIFVGAAAIALAPASSGSLVLTVVLFSVTLAGIRGYLPAFWSLPNLFLSGAAAAGSIGFINSVGNLGGYMGPTVLGKVEKVTGSFTGGLYFLAVCIALAATIIFGLYRWHRAELRALTETKAPPSALDPSR
jgi:ACS family tartrate transporter-like MFS transporter